MANIAVALTIRLVPNNPYRNALAYPIVLGIGDLGLATATLKAISGHVYDTNHAAKVGVPVLLFRQSDNLFIGQTTTNASGIYSFARRSDDTATYYTIAYVTTGTQVHGVSDRGLVAA